MKEKEVKEPAEMARVETKPVVPFTPFGFMRRFATDMEKLFDEFEDFRFPSLFGREFFPFNREFERVAWTPAVEMFQKNGLFTVKVDLPGLKKEDVKVELIENFLTISGERKEEKEEKFEGFYRTERNYGSFYRQLPLPEGVKVDTVKAEFTAGVLQIVMEVPERKPLTRQIEIKQIEEPLKAQAATMAK